MLLKGVAVAARSSVAGATLVTTEAAERTAGAARMLLRHFLGFAPGKRQKTQAQDLRQAVVAVDSICAVKNLGNAIQELAHSSAPQVSMSWRSRLTNDELYRIPRSLTPYGTVCLSTTVHGKIGALETYHVNPFALLHFATANYSMFATFLAGLVESTPDKLLSVIYYLDKAKPGNQKRPDDARSAQCVYWSFLEFPDWLRARRNGWLPFAYVSVKEQKQGI